MLSVFCLRFISLFVFALYALCGRRRGSTKPLEPLLTSQQNPKVMCLFAANRWGTAVFIHAEKVPFKSGPRKGKLHLSHQNVDADSFAYAVCNMVVPLMQDTGSDLAIADCVKMGHSPEVKQEFAEGKKELFPSAGAPHNVIGGYPPYSHDCSIEDGSLFGPFQEEVSSIVLKKSDSDTQVQIAHLFDEIPKVWCSDKYRDMAKTCIRGYAAILRDIRERDGEPTYR